MEIKTVDDAAVDSSTVGNTTGNTTVDNSNPLPNRLPKPPIQQLIDWIVDPVRYQVQGRQQFGDVFTANLSGLGSMVVISDPKMIQELLSCDPNKFDIGRGNTLISPLLGTTTLLMLDGEAHRNKRKLLMPSFHGERLQTYAQQIEESIASTTQQWQPGKPFAMLTAARQLGLKIIIKVVFGVREGERYDELTPLMRAWLHVLDSPFRASFIFLKFLQRDFGQWYPWTRIQKRQQRLHELLQAEIDERRASEDSDRTDILSLLMAARDENGQGMHDEELRSELLMLLLAGHETTAISISWMLYQVYQNPAIIDRLRQEIASLGDNANPLAILQLPYLNAVCQETLRMYPVATLLFPRIPKEPITLAGQTFPEDVPLVPSIYLVHYREDLYPNPHEFRPERFLERQYAPSEYFPFGGGNRRCIGSALAQMEMKLALAHVVQRYEMLSVDSRPVALGRRGFTFGPQTDVGMVVTSRRKAPNSVSVASGQVQ
ncbi:cytochrome P450 [Alkalinema sp. FACHB-956]|uniref:cytochrome P450 n=1 Tax=Alkalinema sp. FACHB-956 TaxID=2692768 RepID=UPI001688C324|nr:cytochrome P450 [Alkalinema sp. FACHB-956]MBD2327591.1 cytochrome P450 [Alkalinema sp. FACHB-956]